MSKIEKTPKTPKCQINGTFWHFAFSEPPGPALFEFQGVPRDPILRPKSGYAILNGKSDICVLCISAFWSFCDLHILWFWCEVAFSSFMHFHVLLLVLNCNKALLWTKSGPFLLYRGEMMYVWWFSSHWFYRRERWCMCGGSPLCLIIQFFVCFVLFYTCRGDSQERRCFILL